MASRNLAAPTAALNGWQAGSHRRLAYGVVGSGTRGNFQSWAAALAKRRMEDLRRDSPRSALTCPKPDKAGIGVGKVVQTPGLLLMLLRRNTSIARSSSTAFSFRSDPNPDWMGYSVGQWAERHAHSDTVGFNDRTRPRGDGVPGTEQLHVTERIRRSDFGHMEVWTTYVDPGVLLAPWDVTTGEVRAGRRSAASNMSATKMSATGRTWSARPRRRSAKLDPKLLAEYAGAYEYSEPGSP